MPDDLSILAVKAAAMRKSALGDVDLDTVRRDKPRTRIPLTVLDGVPGAGRAAETATGSPSMLARMLKSRGGKAGVGLAALTGLGGAGYALFGGGGDVPAPASPSPEVAPAPPAAAPHPRHAVRRMGWQNAGKAIGNWWGRMRQRYGSAPQEFQA